MRTRSEPWLFLLVLFWAWMLLTADLKLIWPGSGHECVQLHFFKPCALLYAALPMTRPSLFRWWCGCYSAACWSSCTLMSACWYRPARTSPGWGMKTLHWLPEWEAAVSAPQVLLALVLQVCPHSALSSAQLLEVLHGNRSTVLICLLLVCSQQRWHDPH